ncbi:ferritin-3, chloroplastic-like isoform X2 [Brassica rapa]|uniref:ferritin-3, chloroplastic isoform X2 n=1 Tax=Brassica napus TaxID=3708 RepID=UPI00142D4D3E|nr:ferritin-3, chloroplastic isoform X2 [Brassica napus]XP_018512166.2 ferritin-3, chloroplastic-like isoform X2 [Brassica rapa]XP_048629536.1 ferritin-3, chloroplastic-like isoform X2 [Brassica napus]
MYSLECEAAVNEQVFQGLKCGRKRPRKMLMDQQEKRGGRVQLKPMVMPQSKFDYADKGDVVYAMELALSLEKLVNAKLLYVFFKDGFLI